MIWQGNLLKPVYDTIANDFVSIQKNLVRFDYWLDMMIENADEIEKLYPGKVICFNSDTQKEIPGDTIIVCFPKTPKPSQYLSEWVKQYWIP